MSVTRADMRCMLIDVPSGVSSIDITV
jgi:hypothetical protein